MLTRILNPYRVSVTDKARSAGFDDRTFPNKKAALIYVKHVRVVDPDFNPPLRIAFRYFDSATGALYINRAEYEQEQERLRQWRIQRDAAKQTNETTLP
jgi:hypothetical protein